MKLNRTLTASVALVVGLSAPAFAGPVGVSRAPVSNAQPAEMTAQLTTARQEAEHNARLLTKGSGAMLDRMKIVEIDNLINRLERGELVSQEEIGRALKR
jgi:hypothetical protein